MQTSLIDFLPRRPHFCAFVIFGVVRVVLSRLSTALKRSSNGEWSGSNFEWQLTPLDDAATACQLDLSAVSCQPSAIYKSESLIRGSNS